MRNSSKFHASRALCITDVELVRASPAEARTGLFGYVSCTLNGGIALDGITLRRTRFGRALSFPAKLDRQGFEHHYVRPLDDETRREIERQVFAQIDVDSELAR